MVDLEIVSLSASAADTSGESTRLLLLVLLLVAVVLILVGCSIALLTFRKQRLVSRSASESGRIESKRI
jgi:flagellar basal body-associated protein FliL